MPGRSSPSASPCQLDAVSGLLVLVLFALGPDLRDHAPKNTLRERAGPEPHGTPGTHVTNLTFRYLDADKQVAGIGHAADFCAFFEVTTEHPWQFFAKNQPCLGCGEFKLRPFALKDAAALFEGGGEVAEGLQLTTKACNLQTFSFKV